MIRFARDFRLIPVVLLATIALFVLKVSGLVFDGGYTLGERLESRNKSGLQIVAPESVPKYPKIIIAGNPNSSHTPAAPKQSWAQEMFNFNEFGSRDVTGSVDKPDKKEEPKLKVSDKPPPPPKLEAGGGAYNLEPGHIRSPGERAILESLHNRRSQLDARSRELDMRENLLKAAEKQVDAKVGELKGVETRVKTEMGTRDKVEAQRLKGIITMYETMKPKEAARIFDRLDMKILVDVSTRMNPRAMSAILAQMTPEAAERLTVELANHASNQPMVANTDKLPKIEGKPKGP